MFPFPFCFCRLNRWALKPFDEMKGTPFKRNLGQFNDIGMSQTLQDPDFSQRRDGESLHLVVHDNLLHGVLFARHLVNSRWHDTTTSTPSSKMTKYLPKSPLANLLFDIIFVEFRTPNKRPGSSGNNCRLRRRRDLFNFRFLYFLGLNRRFTRRDFRKRSLGRKRRIRDSLAISFLSIRAIK